MAIYTVNIRGKFAGQNVENVVHLREQDGFVATKQQIADNLFTWWTGHIRNIQVQHFTWTEYKIRKTYDDNDAAVVIPFNQGGTLPEQNQSACSTTAVFQKKTAVGGRTGRGRVCVPGVPGTAFNDGLWNASYIALMQAVRTVFLGRWCGDNPATHLHLVLVPKHAQGEEYKIVTDFVPRNYPGTQVKRNFFRGR